MSGWASIYSTTRLGLRRQSEALASLQQTVATGVRLRRVSDEPAEAYRLLGLRDESRDLTACRENIARINDSFTVAADVLSQMSGLMARARELLAQATSGTYSAANRKPIAQEINALLEQAVLLANTRHGGQYLFGGSRTGAAPYEVEIEGDRIVAVRYAGGARAVEAPVGGDVTHPTTLVGDAVFRGRDRRRPEFFGDTGAAPGAATSTVRTNVWLTATHDATAYLGASGIAPGTGSADGDTILGDGHTLAIDEPAGTLSLDGGPDVAFTPGDTNVCVAGADGDRVYVDTSGLAAGFQGTVGIQATGSLSIDDGASVTAIDFAETDLGVTHSATGRVLYVDATGIERTGTESVRVPGTADLFGMLITIRDLMQNTGGLAESDQLTYLNQMSNVLNEVASSVTVAQTSVGSAIGTLGTLDEGLEDRVNQADDQAAAIENADMVQLATELAHRQTVYEMTLASAAQLLRLSLFDYIRL